MTRRHDRYREIAETLSRHGMGYLVDAVGLEQLVPFHHGLLGHERREKPYTRPEHLRLALEQLGTTFVKLGQILSTRPDLVGAEFEAELSKLQDAAPAVSFEAVADAISSELGRPVDEAYETFEREPLAAASIGQAHAATLHDGTEVVVKVRRPGVVEQVEQDLDILQNLAARAQRRWQAAAHYDLVGLAAEFATTLRAELDYLREGRNAERFAANFAGDPELHIPRVLWETSTSRVLTLERIRGINVSELRALDAAGIDRPALAERATRVVAEMVFEDGFFHADPHPGNFFIETAGTIGLIDFGMVGEIDEVLRERLGALLLALAREDPDRIATALLQLATAHGPVDRARLRADIERMVSRYAGKPIGELPLGALIGDVVDIIRRNELELPRELALLVKAVVMLEGVGARLDPEIRLGEVLAPYAQRFVTRMLSPAAIAQRLRQAGLDIAQLGLELPEQLHRMLALLESEGLRLRLPPEDLEALATTIRRRDDRLVVAVLAATLVRHAVYLVTADPERRRGGNAQLLTLGVGAAAGLGIYLVRAARAR